MASPGLCLPATQVCGPPPLECGVGLGRDEPTWQLGWRHSHPVVRLCTTYMNAISHQDLSAFSQAPAWEWVVSCAFVITCTWNCITSGLKSSKHHLAFVDTSHTLTSAERSVKLLTLVCNERKRISQLASGSTQMPGEDTGCDAWMSSPSHLGGLLMESTQMKI